MTTHRHIIRVYYEDTDAGGVVYHARYLAFAERARTEAMRALGVPHEQLVRDHGSSFMVRRAELEYLRPARLDDSVTVETTTLAVGAASVSLRQVFLLQDERLAVAHLTLACVRVADGRPVRMPPPWRAALAGNMADDARPTMDGMAAELDGEKASGPGG
jgi:acyl-CoA thioester hydrolase